MIQLRHFVSRFQDPKFLTLAPSWPCYEFSGFWLSPPSWWWPRMRTFFEKGQFERNSHSWNDTKFSPFEASPVDWNENGNSKLCQRTLISDPRNRSVRIKLTNLSKFHEPQLNLPIFENLLILQNRSFSFPNSLMLHRINGSSVWSDRIGSYDHLFQVRKVSRLKNLPIIVSSSNSFSAGPLISPT